MLGRPLVRHAGRRTPGRDGAAPGEVAFESAGLTRAGVFGPVNLTIRCGEIVGMAGLIGSGRSEFAQTVIGRDKLTGGQLTVAGRPVSIRSVRQAVRHGVGYVPEERQAQGLFLALSSKINVSMAALGRIQSWGVVSPRRESRYVRDALARLAVKGDINAPVSHAVRRHPAEGTAGPVAGAAAERAHPRRADPRHRRGDPASRSTRSSRGSPSPGWRSC